MPLCKIPICKSLLLAQLLEKGRGESSSHITFVALFNKAKNCRGKVKDDDVNLFSWHLFSGPACRHWKMHKSWHSDALLKNLSCSLLGATSHIPAISQGFSCHLLTVPFLLQDLSKMVQCSWQVPPSQSSTLTGFLEELWGAEHLDTHWVRMQNVTGSLGFSAREIWGGVLSKDPKLILQHLIEDDLIVHACERLLLNVLAVANTVWARCWKHSTSPAYQT